MRIIATGLARTIPLLPRPLVGRVASSYIAGDSLNDAVRCVAALAEQGFSATVDVLGEDVTRADEVLAMAAEYRAVARALDSQGLDAYLSVKPTAFGLELDPALCREQIARLAREVAPRLVRIEMERPETVDATLDLYESLVDDGLESLGTVLQSRLRRTVADARRLAARGANVRLVKGIYAAPRNVAFLDPQLVRASYLETARILLDGGCAVAFATHDERLVWPCRDLVSARGLGLDRYEFQMLLGIDEELRRLILADGHRLRVYVPYGTRWYEYSLRRLQESPAVGVHVARATLRRLVTRA